MSSKPCYVQKCKEVALFSCSCSQKIFICQTHISNHLLSLGDHIPKKSAAIATEELKQKFSKSIIKHKNTLKVNKKKLLKISKELTTMIANECKKLLKKIKNEKINLNLALQSFKSNKLVDVEIIETFLGKEDSDFTLFEFDLKGIKKELNILFSIDTKKSIQNIKDSALIFKTSSTSQIDLIHLKTFAKTSLDLKSDGLVQCCSCCKIDEDKYFIHGGYPPITGATKIIDLKNKTVEVLASNSQICAAGSCFLNNDIYIFGGSNNSGPVKSCKKFNLKKKVWSSIQFLPELNDRTSASIFHNTIYVTGYQSSKIFTYSHERNKFFLFNDTLSPNVYKYLVENWLVCFGLCLFEIDDNGTLVNRQPLKDPGYNLNSSAYFKREKFFYFVLYGPKLYRINGKMKTIELIDIS